MSTLGASPLAAPLVVRLGPVSQKLTNDEFLEFCRLNEGWRIERTAEGELLLMSPVGGTSGHEEYNLAGIFYRWCEADGRGLGFSSSTGFRLPNGAVRCPDLAWVEHAQWQSLSQEDREGFPPLCPPFLAEVRSATDNLSDLQNKMAEYMANGTRLGWLIDPRERKVYIYRPDTAVVCLDEPVTISGDPLLAGFQLELKRVWG